MEVTNFENTQKEFFNLEITNQVQSSTKQSTYQEKLNKKIVEEQIKAIFNLKEDAFFGKGRRGNEESQSEKEVSEKRRYEEEVNSIRDAEFQIKKVIDIKFKESILQKTRNQGESEYLKNSVEKIGKEVEFDEKKELNEVLKVLKDKDSNFLSLNKLKSGPEVLIKAFYKTIDCFVRLQKERFFEENYKNQVLFDKLAFCLNQPSIDMKIVHLKEFLSSEIENINRLFKIIHQLLEAYLDGGTFLNSFYLFEKTLISIRFSMVFDFKIFIIKLFIQHFITRNMILQVFIKEINEFSSVFIDYFDLKHVNQFFEIFKEFFILNPSLDDGIPYENLNSDSFYEEKIRKIENNWNVDRKVLYQKEKDESDGERIPILSELVDSCKVYNIDKYSLEDMIEDDIKGMNEEVLYNSETRKADINQNVDYYMRHLYDLDLFDQENDNEDGYEYDDNDVNNIEQRLINFYSNHENKNHFLVESQPTKSFDENINNIDNVSLLSAYSYLLNKTKHNHICHDCINTQCLKTKDNQCENGIFTLINNNSHDESMKTHLYQSSVISGIDLKLDMNITNLISSKNEKEKDAEKEREKEKEKQREKELVHEFVKKEKLVNGSQTQKQAFSSVIGNINQIKSKLPQTSSSANESDMSKKDINDLVDFINSTKQIGQVKEEVKKGKKRKKKKGNLQEEELVLTKENSEIVERNSQSNGEVNGKRKVNRVVNLEDEKEIENFRKMVVSCSVHSAFVYKIKLYIDKES